MSQVSMTANRVPWYLWPFHAIWRLITWIVRLTGRLLAAEWKLQAHEGTITHLAPVDTDQLLQEIVRRQDQLQSENQGGQRL